MKKVILGLVAIVASSLPMVAQNANNNVNGTSQKAKCEQVQDCKKACPFEKEFAGINLSDAQKDQLKKLFAERKANKVKPSKEGKENAPKEKLTPEQRKQKRSEMQAKRMEGKKKFLADVKSILTPEQYTQFLENNFLQGGDKGKGFKKGGPKGQKDGKFAKGHKRGHRDGKMAKGHRNGKGPRGNKAETQKSNLAV